MKKTLTLLLALGLVAALTPALAEPGSNGVDAGEDVAVEAQMAPAAVAAVSETGATEALECLAAHAATVPALEALQASDFPVFKTVLDMPTTSLTITCNLCSTHADCQSVCGGQPIYDFICSRHFNSCYGWGPKVCICT